MTDRKLIKALKAKARAEGFDQIGITRPKLSARNRQGLEAFLEAGWHGDMQWMEEKKERRLAPEKLWPGARSLIMLAMNYGPDHNPLEALDEKRNGTLSVYAKGKDYHDIIKKKLKNIARWLVSETGSEVKVFVDTAPVMEKPLSEAAGLGWQGKHTNLVSRDYGSWLFLGAIFTSLELKEDTPELDHCGTCTACLDICPTNAFEGAYRLDARRCISYLTIEHKGHIPAGLRAQMGNRIYGCDDCLAICPWNKFASTASEQRFAARRETDNPPLSELLAMDDAAFRQRFAGTPIKRTGRDRFLRNCLIAAGNSNDPGLKPAVKKLIENWAEPPIVRLAAIWAWRQLADKEEWQTARNAHSSKETDPAIKAEWQQNGENY